MISWVMVAIRGRETLRLARKEIGSGFDMGAELLPLEVLVLGIFGAIVGGRFA